MPEKISETLVRLKSDKNASREVTRDIQAVTDGLKTANTELGKMGIGAAGGVRRLERTFADMRREVKRNQTGVEDLRQSLRLVEQQERAIAAAAKQRGSAQQSANQAGQGGRLLNRPGVIQPGAAGGGNNLLRVGRGIIAAPDIGPSTDIGRLLVLLGATGASLTTIAVAAGIAAPAVALAAVAIYDIAKAAKEGREALDSALTAQERYYNAVAELTTEQAQDEIARLEQQRASLKTQISETQSALDNAFAQAVESTPAVSRLFGVAEPITKIYDALGALPTAQLRTRREDLEKQSHEAGLEIARFTQGIDTNAFAANNAAEAERRLAEERDVIGRASRDLAKDAAEDLAERTKWSRLSAEQLEAEQQRLQDLIEQREKEKTVLNILGDGTRESGERLSNLSIELTDLREDLEDLTNTYLEQANAVEAAREKVDQFLGGINRGLERVQSAGQEAFSGFAAYGKATVAVGEAEKALFKARVDSTVKIAQIEATLADQRAEADRALKDALAENERDAGVARLEANREANEDREKEDVRHRAELEAIADRFDLAKKNAIGNRDALAAHQAEQRRDAELDAEQNKYDARIEQIDAELEKQNNLIDARLKDQNRLARKRHAEQLRTAQKAAQAAIRLERDKAQAEINLRQQALSAEIRLQSQAFQQMISIGSDGWGSVVDKARQAFQRLRGLSGGASQSTAGAAGAAAGAAVSNVFSSAISFLPGFQRGGVAHGPAIINERGVESGLNRRGQLAVFSEPTRIFSAEQTRAMTGGATININLDGKTIRVTSRNEAVRYVNELLRSAGTT
jgi:hypothetical protein